MTLIDFLKRIAGTFCEITKSEFILPVVSSTMSSNNLVGLSRSSRPRTITRLTAPGAVHASLTTTN